MEHPDAGVPKLAAPLANPSNFFEVTVDVDAGRAYRLWLRGRAQANAWTNDSVFVQFSGSVNASGGAANRIGTTEALVVSIENCSGCGLSGWGWQDTGYGTNVLGPLVYFAASGPQRIRLQGREDGISLDQIVLSSAIFLNASPGVTKNDTRILPETAETVASTWPAAARGGVLAARAGGRASDTLISILEKPAVAALHDEVEDEIRSPAVSGPAVPGARFMFFPSATHVRDAPIAHRLQRLELLVWHARDRRHPLEQKRQRITVA